MSYPVKPHLPPITSRIEFQLVHFLPPPAITPRQDLGKRLRDRHQIRRNNIPPYDRTHRPHSPNPKTDEPSELSELPSDDDDQPKTKIPKPPGEAGRKNCGGFNLEKALGWEEAKYNELVVSAQVIPARIFHSQNVQRNTLIKQP
jgi:hypothetical protein